MIQGVIFDMDGLLVDSERIGLYALKACGARQGADIPIELIKTTLGATNQFSSDLYRSHFPALDTDRLWRDFIDEMEGRALRGEIPLKKGARELLSRLDALSIPRALASSTRRATVEVYLKSHGITDCFQVILGHPEGARSKPAPDIFLLAAKELGLPPENCLVLEDSVNGVRAGRAAGMTVCMVPDVLPYTPDLAPCCDYVAESLFDAAARFFP